MAWVAATQPTGTSFAGRSNKPLFLVNSLKAAALTSSGWYAGTTISDFSPNDGVLLEEAGRESYMAYNGNPVIPTAPNVITGASERRWDLVFSFPAPGINLDSFLMWGHNFNSANSVVAEVRLSIADDATFTTRVQDIGTFTNPFPLRFNWDGTWNETGNKTIYTGVEHLAVRIRGTDDFASARQPFIGEVVAGTRIQMARKPRRDRYAPDSVVTTQDRFVSDNGNLYVFTRGTGQAVWEYTWDCLPLGGNPQFSTLDDQASALRLRNETEAFRYPFVYCENPQSSPLAFQFMRADPQFNLTYEEAHVQALTLKMTEQAPFVVGEAF